MDFADKWRSYRVVDTSAEISCCTLGTEDPDPEFLVPSVLRVCVVFVA